VKLPQTRKFLDRALESLHRFSMSAFVGVMTRFCTNFCGLDGRDSILATHSPLSSPNTTSFSAVLRSHALILLIIGVRAVPLLAQDAATASVSGVLLDPSDAGVAGARIALRQNNGTAAATVADASGAFRIDGVHPGNDPIVVKHEGFNPASVKVHLGAANPAPLTIRLSLAELRNESRSMPRPPRSAPTPRTTSTPAR